MNALPLLLVIGVAALIVWIGRRSPLTGRRRTVAMASRLIAVLALCAALWGVTYSRLHELPRRVIYLVDRSASIDEAQLAWMARRVASLEALRPAKVERALVVFGATTQVLLPVGTERMTDAVALERLLASASVDRTHTSLEAGVLASLALLKAGREAGVVLLSDGRETTGNVAEVLSYVRRLGVEIFSVAPPVAARTRTVWEELVVPPSVRKGASVPAQLVVWSGSSDGKDGQVTVLLSGVAVKRQPVAIRPGWQVISVPVPAVQRGTMALEVRLAVSGEGLVEERRAYTEVEGPPRVLMVTDRPAVLPALATALRRRDMELAFARPQELSVDAGQLLDEDAILLFNVPKSSITAPQAEALRAYLEQSGGGLVTVGLGGDLAQELNTSAPLDALLPVRFEPKGLEEAKRRVCMVMLIDRSASMIGPRIAATKRAAVELVKQLSPEDLVGVLAFDTKPYVIAEVQQAGQVAPWIVEKLVKLRSTGGTDVFPALAAAANRLELTDAKLKHIILLSDGNTPVPMQAYEALLESFRQNGVTISTIGIGSVFINTDYLQWLAKSTGGTYYELHSLEELPSLIARDTQAALGRLPFTEGLFKPSRASATEWFTEMPDLPSLRGYLTASAKPGATVDVTVNAGAGDDPLFARWVLGKGRVVSFTSDADTRWSPDWIRWNGFEAGWAQVVRWAMRPRLTEELFVRVEDDRGSPRLVLEGELHEPQGALVAAEGSGRIPLSLIETGQWRWHAALDQAPSGWYQLVVESRAPGGGAAAPPVFAKRWIQLGIPPASKGLTGQPPREALLQQLARATAGAYDTPDLALLPPTTEALTREPLLLWWLALAMLALLVDVAARGNTML